MGSVYPRKRKLWIRFKGPDGEWTQKPTRFRPGQERQAKKLLERVENKIAAGEALGEAELGPVTVRRFAKKWLEDRQALGIADWKNDKARLELHVLRHVGDLRLDEVRPRHMVGLFKKLRMTDLAPKTIYNIYSVVKAMFRDALLDDLIDATPCILSKYQLGQNEDKDSEWRATAIYNRDELEMLISDERVPWDRQVFYGLEGIGGLRHGEAAGICWCHYEASLKPLGRFVVATSYDRGQTKTGRTRFMPVHPTLAAMLAQWKLHGWPEMMGRQPTPDDLIVPLPKSPRTEAGTMRTKNHSYKRLTKDLEALGLRHRRGHDLRRTMISLARMDGARKDILEICTHNPRKRGSTIDVYTEFPWESLCAEVAKLKVQRRERGRIISLPLAAAAGNPVESGGGKDALATPLATPPAKGVLFQEGNRWRRRESKPVHPRVFTSDCAGLHGWADFWRVRATPVSARR